MAGAGHVQRAVRRTGARNPEALTTASGNKSLVEPAHKATHHGHRREGRANEIKVVAVLDDLAVGPDQQAGGAGIDELDPFDLQAHRPLHEGCIATERHGARLKEDVIAAAHQSILGNDVGLDAALLLGWILEMNIVVVDGPPLLS